MGRSRNALGYVRTSLAEDSDPLMAVEAQKKAIEDYASFRQLNLEEVLIDAGVSGSVPLEARPQGGDLARWVHKPRVHSILTFRFDRLFASARECVTAIDRWEEKHIALHVLDMDNESVDTFTPVGRMVISVLRAAHQMEELQREDSQLRDLHRRKKGGKLLLGEKVVRGFVVPDPVEAHAVERIQQLSDQGKSLRLIAEALDQEGVPTKRRAKSWSKEAIRLILRRIGNNEVRDLRPTEGVEVTPPVDG